jgi:hypothetical protein
MFNVGVEAGQLLFIAAVLVAISVWKFFIRFELTWLPRVIVYAIGSMASYWIFTRIAAF